MRFLALSLSVALLLGCSADDSAATSDSSGKDKTAADSKAPAHPATAESEDKGDESTTSESDSDEVVVIDVRTQEEWDEGHIEGAIHIPLAQLEAKIAEHVPDKGRKIGLY